MSGQRLFSPCSMSCLTYVSYRIIFQRYTEEENCVQSKVAQLRFVPGVPLSTCRTQSKMPRSFRELSSRQKNRRLEAYERYERKTTVDKSTVKHVDRSTVNIEVASLESLASINVPITHCTLSDDSNSGNTLNVFSADVARPNIHVTLEEEDKENIEENTNKTAKLSNWLRSWTLKYNISHTALSELLSKLRTYGHTDMPKSARTLLNTPRNSIIKVSAEKGNFFHYGLKEAITEQLIRTKFIVINEVIMIDLNIDGLPISKSSKSQIWPILDKIHGDKIFKPFVISAYHGYSKPPSVDAF
ncbi:uncharacterized protein LOC112588512 isoform X2 [Harpegnathos saltator]|uniref:uncharacterized protein LOC112588512 isoform X2 n=1 Tax=Harpegnathos saltator TaxID=610380 RepID=UPI000DBEEFD9|nr:uncharacterized protein LOC112588512 isoform X2 [Harpegnathos saltator]